MHILLVGKSFSGIKTYLTNHGYTYTVLQDELATKFPDKRLRHRVVTTFADISKLLEAVDRIHLKNPINGILTTYENYILSASKIAAHLGLPGLSETTAQACTDKELMRKLFASAPEKISPAFQAVADEKEVLTFALSHSFPLILKPANLSKSLLVTKNNTIEELIANYHKSVGLLSSTYAKYAPGRAPKLIIEEFLEGPIFSVDAFVDNTGRPHVLENVVDYQTGYDIGFDDNFHYSRILPSRLPKKDIDAIRHAAAVGCRALGMTSSPAHVEIILTHEGPRIVEIGARNGGYRERMHALANDIDITGNSIALSLNQPLNIQPKHNDFVGVFELFPKKAGKFRGIEYLTELEKLPSLYYLSVKAKVGRYVGKSGDGYKMCAVVILASTNKDQFVKDVEVLKSHINIITDESSSIN